MTMASAQSAYTPHADAQQPRRCGAVRSEAITTILASGSRPSPETPLQNKSPSEDLTFVIISAG